jgi:hypothetical protein
MSKNADHLTEEDLFQAAERLISPRPRLRDNALDQLYSNGVFSASPLAAFLLATRVADKDIEVRFHAIQYLGKLLDYERAGNQVFNDQTLEIVHGFFLEIGVDQIEKILEIAELYLSAESSILNIFKICSCAGRLLSGIVNDRKKAPYLRQQAIFFSGELGLVEMVPVLENLILRIDKSRKKSDRTISSERLSEEEILYTKAVVALEKLKSGPVELNSLT